MNDRNLPYRSWRRVAFPASIVLNLFFIALIGGHVIAARDQRDFDTLAQALATAEASLPPKDASAFHKVIENKAAHYEEASRQLREARHVLGQQITAEPFNADAVRQALSNWRTAWNGFFDSFSDPLVDALSVVSPEGRRKLIADREAARRRQPASALGQ